jgi:hypothetical protein
MVTLTRQNAEEAAVKMFLAAGESTSKGSKRQNGGSRSALPSDRGSSALPSDSKKTGSSEKSSANGIHQNNDRGYEGGTDY